MSETTENTHGVNGANGKTKNPLLQIQARIGTFEAEARGQLKRALGKGNGALLELDGALEKVSREDWTVGAMRKRLDGLVARAENLRAVALKRVAEMPGTAVSAIATSTRAPVQNLARELERLAKLLDRAEPPKSA